ncbi:MAG TPA: FGGY family carbohydrate kinase [Pedobacter sp.]|jgi:sugar (pentulose or hexulose) kinase
MKIPVIAIFDIGKTNKKLFLFDEQYTIVYEKTARFTESVDEDGDTCEDLDELRSSMFDSLKEVQKLDQFDIKAINFSGYGASLVYVNESGEPLTPLYSYLKPYPEQLQKDFYNTYGGEETFSKETCSPVLGSLNSAMQLYRLKHEKPEIFKQIKYALHLPQYLSFLFTRKAFSDITSIGCHTNLWNFTKNDYHPWVSREGLIEKLAPIAPSNSVSPASFEGQSYLTGVGLHDSSAALIPYLVNFQEPFILISTGTWCISLNPFNDSPLTEDELNADCLSYLQYNGKPVKAARLFAGFKHEQEVKRIASHFNVDIEKYKTIAYDPAIIQSLQNTAGNKENIHLQDSDFSKKAMESFSSDADAYHQLMLDLVKQQYQSTQLVLTGSNIKRIFVDGGFSKNSIYMNLLALFFPNIEIFAASVAQATAVGAALSIHHKWNTKPLPNDIIELRNYS